MVVTVIDATDTLLKIKVELDLLSQWRDQAARVHGQKHLD
jgi:hypothetical protein